MNDRDYAFQMSTSNLRFGPGVTREVGQDVAELGLKRVLLVVDSQLVDLPPVRVAEESLKKSGIDYDRFDGVRTEPNDRSFQTAIDVASSGMYEGFVAVGGGSTIDTAKAANLYSTYPAEFLTYVNAPIGQGKPVPGPLKPLIAIPTTAGTGSETTGVAICDLTDLRLKTGIADRRLKPTLGLLDPENTRTMPPLAAATTGLDVLCHALESYTALPFNQRPLPESPSVRPAYQGRNPISDVWAERSMAMLTQFLIRAWQDPTDDEARSAMILASSYAGMGFGNAGVHLCHGMSYPISSMVRDFHPAGYPTDHPLIPHGMSVALPAPAVFRFTAPACPDRHLKAAGILGADITGAGPEDAGPTLSARLVWLMQQLKMPSGLAALGYTADDIPRLVEGTLPQHRVTKLSPRPAEAEDLAKMFAESLVLG